MTDLIARSCELIHRAGRRVSVTPVLSALPNGDLAPPEQLKAMTGLDLPAVLRAAASAAPDTVCPEFLWQQWRSHYADQPDAAIVFTPEWTGRALSSFLSWIDTPVQVVAHVEITDFPNAPADAAAMRASLRSAVRAGASGIDVYASHLLDEKRAWAALKSAKNLVRTKRCVVLYEGETGHSDAVQVGEMIRHFRADVSLMVMDAYTTGALQSFDNAFYVGTSYREKMPPGFLSDLQSARTPVCWLGWNIEPVLEDESISRRLGMEYAGFEEGRFTHVSYKGHFLNKEDPNTHEIRIMDETKCRTMAMATAVDGAATPYVVHSGRNFWWFADVPPMFAVEGGRFLVFADLLHEILNEDHAAKRLAMVRIEDVHPLSAPDSLRKIADYLYREGVPFQVGIVPVYVYPQEDERVRLRDAPEFVEAIHYMVRKGGTVVLHGFTHQRYGETTSDYEFWDPLTDTPPEGMNRQTIRAKLEGALRECWASGIYPLMWETPHYAGSQDFYSVLPEFFSLAMERRQSADRVGTDQYFPYLIPRDRFGQMIVPENLGYVPLDRASASGIIEPARNMAVVRDGVASFFFHPFIDLKVLKGIVRTMKREGFVFTCVADLPIRVKTTFGEVTNQSGAVRISTRIVSGREARLAFPGNILSTAEIPPDPAGEYQRQTLLRGSDLFAAHFIALDEDAVSAPEGATGQTDHAALLQRVTNPFGEECSVPVPLLLVDARSTGPVLIEQRAFQSAFRAICVDVPSCNVADFREAPPGVNVVVVPGGVAATLREDQTAALVSALRESHTALVTSGFSALSDQIGIQRKTGAIKVRNVQDQLYPDVKITWDPPLETSPFESPGEALFLYADVDSGEPLMVASPFGQGRFLFLSTPLDDVSTEGGKRYPYFLTHFLQSLRVYPSARKAGLEVYFNPADRGEEVSMEDLVKTWRRCGVRVVYAAAWQVFPEWTYDYERLIHLAHTNAMLVYAWFEPPYVHDKFWEEHPEWREQNALGREPGASWRKPMALGDPACLRAALSETQSILDRFDWDGIVLDRVGWESPGGGLDSPETFVPFHPTVRKAFLEKAGFDPLALADPASERFWKTNPAALDDFRRFRAALAVTILESYLNLIADMKKNGRDYWELVVTHQSADPECGITLQDLESLKARFHFALQLAPAPAMKWEAPSKSFDLAQISLEPGPDGSPFHPNAPTQYPTGLAFYNLLQDAFRNNRRFSLKSEGALYEVDTQFLPFLAASTVQEVWTRDALVTRSPRCFDAMMSKIPGERLLMDKELAASYYMNRLIVPAGEHRITIPNHANKTLTHLQSKTRLVDTSADILRTRVTLRGIEVAYRTATRAIVVVSDRPKSVSVDGHTILFDARKGLRGWTLALPPGDHEAVIVSRGILETGLVLLSLLLSNAIVLISACAILGLIVILLVLWARKRALQHRLSIPLD